MSTRSKADRIGQLIFVLVVVGLIAAGMAWLVSATSGHWWMWPILTVGVIVVAMLLGSGIMSALGGGSSKDTPGTSSDGT